MKSLSIVKNVIILLLCYSSLIFNSGCQSTNDLFQENLTANRMGDISGSILNTIVKQGDKFYYVNDDAGGKIYSIFKDGTGKKKLNKCESSIIGVKDGWIYYNNIDKKNDLYRMKIDGTENNKLKSGDGYAYYYVLNGDWVYYLFKDNNIYRTKVDGSVTERVVNDSVYEMNIVDDFIYYVNRTDGGSLYKIKVDGKERTKLNNVDTYCISIYKNWVVFLNYNDNNRLYKVKTDGTNFSGLINYKDPSYNGCFDNVEKLTIDGDWIYYCNPEINRVKFDSPLITTKIGNSGSYGFTICGDWVYFLLEPNMNKIGRVNIDGTTVNPQVVN
ncbi:DUF5050 domain-containing protein [Ruminiclostridium papyrosolvens]|uniref:Prolow-density lipoprotein receptor-related protein 1-like beta-propeller domain-containing protein n=1 Tax=Ruminiclostridium papyrosolvens C7 TaxID=1330534 RepID=U4QYS6_9FIRM|nr:DUF5050 domain-containing protein [Ruminiclostridium papyrosolvens]EPR09988.1 hypothetical protein L323_15295 [Ruminiclostridium papyrosolvens C7]